MIVADFRIIPVGEGTSLEEPVERALRVLDEKGVKYEVGPLGTTIEAESLDEVLDAVRMCHATVRSLSDRVFTQVTIDERLDKDETMETLKRV